MEVLGRDLMFAALVLALPADLLWGVRWLAVTFAPRVLGGVRNVVHGDGPVPALGRGLRRAGLGRVTDLRR